MELAIEEMQFYYAQKLIIELLEIGDKNLILYENLIFVCKKLNELDFAYNKINLQYEIDTNNIIYPLLLGDITYYQRLDNEALNWFKIALKLDKNNSNLRHRVANLSESLFKYELSDSIFTKIIEDDSTDASGFNNYAYSLCERPNPNLEFALELSQKAIKLEPENPAFLDTIGWIYYRLGNYDLALNYIFKSAKLDQKSEIILNHLAEVYLKLNNINEALNIYLEILDLNPKNQNALEKLKELSHE